MPDDADEGPGVGKSTKDSQRTGDRVDKMAYPTVRVPGDGMGDETGRTIDINRGARIETPDGVCF